MSYPNPGTTPVVPSDPGGTAVHHATHTVSTLPFTGTDVALLVVIGLLLVVAGYLLFRGTRVTATHGDHFE